MSLSTHVLDTVRGIPAEAIRIELWKINSKNESALIGEDKTNSDGRLDTPLISVEEFTKGEYELVFFVADYFQSKGDKLSDPPFLNKVPIRFGISDVGSHYHVPLLISPWSYSTYRGS